MNEYEYWIGDGIDIDELWKSYENGLAYINKFQTMEIYQAVIKFDQYSLAEPIFNFELIYKCFKSLYHDVKKECFTNHEYNSFGPLYLYEVKRGSELLKVLGELRPLLITSSLLSTALALTKLKRSNLAFDSDRIKFLEERFPHAPINLKTEYLKSLTFIGRNKALEKLMFFNLVSVQITKDPFKKGGDDASGLIDVTKLLI